MTQEDKELLLKDLSSRLPYGVIVDIKYNKEHGSSDRLRICNEGSLKLNTDLIGLYIEEEIHLKPYLRPMSSMTEKEFEKLKEYSGLKYEQLDLASFQNGTYKCLDFYLSEVPSYVVILVFDWLNTHHFDYRDLIPKGLALEMPKDMYPKTIITEDEGLNELKELFPISLLEPKELEVALTLYKDSSNKALKYIREKHPELGLKEAKIYYDLYINNKEI